MVDKNYCMSSYLVFRYIIDKDKEFAHSLKHRQYDLLDDSRKTAVKNGKEIDNYLKQRIYGLKNKKIGLLLSGGMDSGCLAPYLQGCDAYTFRFESGLFSSEIERAKYYAKKWNLHLHYVDINWLSVERSIDKLMISKGAPVHSIEPQVYLAAIQAKSDGIQQIVIGDAADYIFGGMDKLLSKDWKYSEFKKRYTYIEPSDVLLNPVDMDLAFRRYKKDDMIDYISLMHKYTDIESFASYENAFHVAELKYEDPYEHLKMAEPLDLTRIRNGESKYLIRELFKMKYPEIPVPEKIPMPRPVDFYFKDWSGPSRPEFRKDIDINKFTGNQKWQLWCLERFLNMIDS